MKSRFYSPFFKGGRSILVFEDAIHYPLMNVFHQPDRGRKAGAEVFAALPTPPEEHDVNRFQQDRHIQ